MDLSGREFASGEEVTALVRRDKPRRVVLRQCRFPDSNRALLQLGSSLGIERLESIDICGIEASGEAKCTFVACMAHRCARICLDELNNVDLEREILLKAPGTVEIVFGDRVCKGSKMDFSSVAELVKRNEGAEEKIKIEGVRYDIDDSPDKGVEGSKSAFESRPKKPWEK